MRVCVLQGAMKAYRVPFFQQLANRLKSEGVDLQVVYGSSGRNDSARGDNADLDAPLGVPVSSFRMFGGLLLLSTFRSWVFADLVIVEHANKHVLNYLLSLLSVLGLKRIAYWGHGLDRQANPNSNGERFKRKSLHWADWWFAYTKGTARYIEQQGFKKERVTVVENAVDVERLALDLKSVSGDEKQRVMSEFGWGPLSRVGVYCGSLYEGKRVDLLLDSAMRVHSLLPDFKLLIVGGGEGAKIASDFSKENSWVQYVGPKFGREKAVCLSLAEVFLNPGVVGLSIVDAFCAGLPFITCDVPGHGPEIDYLDSGVNGMLCRSDSEELANCVCALLETPALLEVLKVGASESARLYSLDSMVENFASGVKGALASPKLFV